MLILPAIDLRHGQCVRLTQGDFAQETVFATDPVEVAQRFKDLGATFLHIVDLDGAKAGHPVQWDVVKKILTQVHVSVELGGGLRTMADIAQALDLGVTRVILGSVAVHNPALVKEACQKFGERIIVGIDAQEDIVKVEGWDTSGHLRAAELAKRMAAVGVRILIHTDIGRDGMLQGLNVQATAKLAKACGLRVIASGGVKSLDDIHAVKRYEKDGVVGVVVGKALYTGNLDLKEAIEIAGEAL